MEDNERYYIRCEMCNSHVNIDDYVIHTRICRENERLRYLRSLIYDNHQIPSGTNMASFIREHFHNVPYSDNRTVENEFVPLASITSDKVKDIDKILIDIVSSGSESHECPICLDEIDNGQGKALSECKHIYCTFCIKKWFTLQNYCPLCKKKYS